MNKHPQSPADARNAEGTRELQKCAVALLTGGGDKPYAFGLATALMARGIALDVVGSDELDCPEFRDKPGVRFLNLRKDQRPEASYAAKVSRVLMYYVRLIRYAATARPRIFHVLWNNKIELFDRTFLMLYYKLLRKKIVLTVHNVNAARRDSRDSSFNRLTLRIQYRLADRIFVHTEKMKQELIEEFRPRASRIAVIPFGINNSVPNTALTSVEARKRLGIKDGRKTILFFGNIAPYKGLEYLVIAFREILASQGDYQLVIAGRPKGSEKYWAGIQEAICEYVQNGRVMLRANFVPDEETEIYFKAADVLVLPYRHIYESGVLYLGYSFGLPVIAADVGSLKEDIVEGETGFLFKPEDPADLARAIEKYFASGLFAELENRRDQIRNYATARHSWEVVSSVTISVYGELVQKPSMPNLAGREPSVDIPDTKPGIPATCGGSERSKERIS